MAIAENHLGTRIRLLTTAHVPTPFAPQLVDEISIGSGKIAAEVQQLLRLK